jgi:hypothetical protein
MRKLILVAAAGLSLMSAGCATTRTRGGADQERTTLLVQNDNYLDHNIYLLNGAERIRLGTARGLTSTKFVIPPQFVFGVAQLQFLADPIGSRVQPVSERVNVSAGDEVQLRIPGR